MEITQLVDPFSAQVAGSKNGLLIFVVVLAIIGGIGYFLYRSNKLSFSDGKLSFNL